MSGLLNTLLVSLIGIFFATIIGFMVALGRLSPNWLMSRISGGYVELIRNLPLLFQILFWYLAVLGALPNPRQSISLIRQLLSQQSRSRGSKADRQAGLRARLSLAVVVAIIGSMLLRSYARQQLFESGTDGPVWPYVLGMLIGLPLLSASFSARPSRSKCPSSRDSISPAARA